MSAAGRMLSKALDDPDDWAVQHGNAYHAKSGTHWKVGESWLWFNGTDGTHACLSLFEKWWLYRKFKRMMNAKVAANLAKGIINGGTRC